MSTPRAVPPTADVDLEKKWQGLKSPEFRQSRDRVRATAQDAPSRAERKRNETDPWPGAVRKCRANAGTASTLRVENAPGSDPSSSHNVALVADTAALSTAMRKDPVGLPLKPFMQVQQNMSIQLDDADLQETNRVVFMIDEDTRVARTEGPPEELDPKLKAFLENDAWQANQKNAESNADHSRASTTLTANLSAENHSADVDQLEGEGYPDSETHGANADEASMHIGFGPGD